MANILRTVTSDIPREAIRRSIRFRENAAAGQRRRREGGWQADFDRTLAMDFALPGSEESNIHHCGIPFPLSVLDVLGNHEVCSASDQHS